MNHRRIRMLAVGIGCLALLPAVAAAQYVYPSQGQSPEQQAADDSQCRAWATQQTGFDPSRGMAPAAASAPTGQGEVLRGAARGAALGVVGGAIAGDAGKGAAIGAGVGATGGLFNRMGASRAQQQQQQQVQAAYQAQGQEFSRAFGACMAGRGYTVN
ncbi:MAG TPA: glycine zipper family protein [Geminicoccaceae bacterium]